MTSGEGGIIDRHFHVVSLQNELRFSLLRFILEVLHDYEVVPLQLASNA